MNELVTKEQPVLLTKRRQKKEVILHTSQNFHT
jgi:hypothetical protein